MDTFATFLNALQEKQAHRGASGTLAVSTEADLGTEHKILDLLKDRPEGVSVDALRTQCGFSFTVLAPTLTSLLAKGAIEITGEPGKENVHSLVTSS